ncbi:MAG: septal ring lytic transglycosylase RlpA family protein [Alphaproteobacteria bacterium]|nr:septal ring lytic transglycosylase RlpA family protein [Alphaproteobacteria bacterium]
MRNYWVKPLLLLLAPLLAACSSMAPENPFRSSADPLTVTRSSGYKVGEPYQVNGIWYYPNEDYSYDETGIASWYGPGFHGARTANGEIFDSNELTAAHPTLPMPTLARVTNLDNGRSIVLRINDRGPFAGGRLIDVSRRASQMLGFEKLGTAKVRVQVLADESKAIAAASRRYGTSQAAKAYANSTFSAAPVTPVATKRVPASRPYTALEPIPPEHVPSDERTKPLELPVMTQVAVKPNPQIYVQAGAFTVAENAQKLQKELRGIGQVSINQAVIKDVSFYRVRLGPYADAGQANGVLHRLTDAGVPGARIVVD